MFSPDEEKHPSSRVPSDGEEKHVTVTELFVESGDGDEALKLVGRERQVHFSEEYNLRLRKKLDRWIPPLSAAIYFTQFLDKTSLNYASIMGFPIKGQASLNYNLVSLAFYLGFLTWEFPTVYISQKLRLGKYLGVNVIIWGVILMLQAITDSFSAFFALRFLMGMCESCVVPILILIISMFYKKSEQATRVAWFYIMNGLTTVFGGFVAYGISFYHGRNIAPYKIVFLFLGGIAIPLGICILLWMPDSPVHAQFLTKEERIAAIERVRDDQGGTENKKLKPEQVKEAVLDIRNWLILLTAIQMGIPAGALSNFSNIIIKSFGYTSKQTLILSTPGGIIAAVTALLCGWYSDKKGERVVPIIIAIVPTIIGCAMLIGLNKSGHKGVLLFAIYLAGTFGSTVSTVYAYNASNTGGHTKKLTINAMTLVTFSVGNIIGAEIFLPKDSPAYIPGKTAIMTLMTSQFFICILLRSINRRLNKKKQKQIEEEKVRNNWTDADVQRERERHAFLDLTDKQLSQGQIIIVYNV
ncbi:MFS general substrate transporter [Multifurca ochricompacta]|uniref:MFS general substrate transporter n=1 Tax=Multifurca ochricompacta TaxID=376703 RepID=A0AAD4M737_9AGAM|nr:MFS general substrate transporter [Multifurca ochricompacta]